MNSNSKRSRQRRWRNRRKKGMICDFVKRNSWRIILSWISTKEERSKFWCSDNRKFEKWMLLMKIWKCLLLPRVWSQWMVSTRAGRRLQRRQRPSISCAQTSRWQQMTQSRQNSESQRNPGPSQVLVQGPPRVAAAIPAWWRKTGSQTTLSRRR